MQRSGNTRRTVSPGGFSRSDHRGCEQFGRSSEEKVEQDQFRKPLNTKLQSYVFHGPLLRNSSCSHSFTEMHVGAGEDGWDEVG